MYITDAIAILGGTISTGHRAQGTGHRAQGTGHRAQGTGAITVFL